MAMELPDEALMYNYEALLVPVLEEWTTAAELRTKHFLSPTRLKELGPRLLQCRSQVTAEREVRNVPPENLPLEAGFIDLPQTLLDNLRRKGEASDLGRCISVANRLRDEADRVVILGVGGSSLGAALFRRAQERPSQRAAAGNETRHAPYLLRRQQLRHRRASGFVRSPANQLRRAGSA